MNGVVANLRSLARFSGRESRTRFWPYAAFVFALSMAGMMAVMIPVMNDFVAKAAQLAAENPDAVTVRAGPGSYSVQVEAGHPEVLPDLDLMFGGAGVVVATVVALFAAAVSRRLHDSGLPGWLGLMPLPFLTCGLIMMPRLFVEVANSETPNLTGVLLLFLNNMAYIAALATLVLLLSRAGSPGPNRYGPAADA